MYFQRNFGKNTGNWREKQDSWPVYTQKEWKDVEPEEL